jgi:cell division topological specificity factor
LPKLQKELIEVVARYVEIREDMIRVNLGKSGETSLLEINIELEGAKPRSAPARGGLAGAATASPPAKSG